MSDKYTAILIGMVIVAVGAVASSAIYFYQQTQQEAIKAGLVESPVFMGSSSTMWVKPNEQPDRRHQ